jgi:hypothetical protein
MLMIIDKSTIMEGEVRARTPPRPGADCHRRARMGA